MVPTLDIDSGGPRELVPKSFFGNKTKNVKTTISIGYKTVVIKNVLDQDKNNQLIARKKDTGGPLGNLIMNRRCFASSR